jgi:hypothetical protein
MRDPACEHIECSLGVFYQQRVWMVQGGNGHRLGVVLDGRACCGYFGTTKILSMTKSYICFVPVLLRRNPFCLSWFGRKSAIQSWMISAVVPDWATPSEHQSRAR